MTRPLNATAASLLGFLHRGDLSGWDLFAAAHHEIGDFWTVTRSQVYRELTALNSGGYVERLDAGARDRTPYRITDAGRDAFAEWISRPPGPETIRHPLLLTLAFGEHVSTASLLETAQLHRTAHEERLAGYRQQMGRPELDRFATATLEFGIAYESAVVGWFDKLPHILDLPHIPDTTR